MKKLVVMTLEIDFTHFNELIYISEDGLSVCSLLI